MKTPSSAPAKRRAPAIIFRREIEAAIAAGATAETLMLKLTVADASLLKRDPTLALTDISFTGGLMRFLGVPVEQGSVSVSELVTA
jgi:hypothetical protein